MLNGISFVYDAEKSNIKTVLQCSTAFPLNYVVREKSEEKKAAECSKKINY